LRQKCSLCHPHQTVLDFLKPEMAWEETVERMAELSQGSISDADKATILNYLKAVRSPGDRQLFILKCRQCHIFANILGHERSPEQWDRIVNRVWREDFHWMQREEANQIKRYIRSRLSPGTTGSPGASDRARDTHGEIFEEKCGRCHYLDICLERKFSNEEWTSILRRMSAKCPDYLGQEEAESLLGWLLREIEHSEEFYHRFPHSKPLGS